MKPESFQNTRGEGAGLPTGFQPNVSQGPSSGGALSTSPAQTAVLVITFNGGAYIEEQLHSIMRQTLPPRRVHIFDDGSTDDTVGIVKRFIETHHLDQWTVTVNATNLGPAHNVLRNLKHLKAQTVFFADQDDVWDPNKMEVMHAYLQANPEVGLLLSETELVDGEGNPLPARLARHVRRSARLARHVRRSATRRSAQVRPIVNKRFYGESRVPLHAMAVRGDIVEEIASAFPFPPLSRSLGADWYIGMWATLTASAATLPDVLMRRRVHGSNISLGRLRKETALSTNRANRIAILEEARNAHAAVLESPVLGRRMTSAQSSALRRMVAFYDARLGFISEPSVGRALLLLKWISAYIAAGDGWRGGARALASDLAYGGNINFKTRRKMPRNA